MAGRFEALFAAMVRSHILTEWSLQTVMAIAGFLSRHVIVVTLRVAARVEASSDGWADKLLKWMEPKNNLANSKASGEAHSAGRGPRRSLGDAGRVLRERARRWADEHPGARTPPASVVDALEDAARADPNASAWIIALEDYYHKLETCG